MPRAPKITPPPIVTPAATRPSRAVPVIVILSTLLLIALSVAGYFYYQYRQSPQVADAKEIVTLTTEIGAIFELPQGEEPTLATVTDREKLAEQAFFQKAENGDKVLIYSGSGRAILYRPSTKKIIDVTTVNVNQPAAEVPPVTAPAQAEAPAVAAETAPLIVRVAIYNGSTTVGVTNVIENQLKGVIANAAVVTKENAAKNDYVKTIVSDLSGKNADAASQIATALKGEVGALPAGEAVPIDADIVIIVGSER